MEKLLVLIMTYRCNLNCGYCPTIKKSESMNWEVAKRSLDLFNKLEIENAKIKFFGGEPLLEYDLIKKIIEYNKGENNLVNYELTTNGVLLDSDKLNFFKENNFELHVSIDGDRQTQVLERGEDAWKVFNNLTDEDRKFVIVNIVVSPKQVDKFYDNLKFLFESGFDKFNILPAFFNEWSETNINDFYNELKKISGFVKNNNIYIQNKDILNDSYLFNKGYVIDCNGDIYFSNRIMIKKYKKERNMLKIASIFDIANFNNLKIKRQFLEPRDKENLINLRLNELFNEFIEEMI